MDFKSRARKLKTDIPALFIALRLIPKDVLKQCRIESENIWKNEKRKNGIMLFLLF